ncbi:MAG: filamentous hemagglutinin N-terminal domain-containing protein [Vampirovibrionales bacterium]|nr:filamentous hemagglutinin N-terminal domain-containing protein [Vampirovibrionales bacterium]
MKNFYSQPRDFNDWIRRGMAHASQCLASPKTMPRAAASLLMSLLLAQNAAALPSGWQVESGDVSFDVVNGNTLNVTSHQAHAIINWQQFNIAQGETVNFLLSNNLASILNRISGGASVINGALNSNGTVILSNPAGLTFGNTANVNVGNLIATTLHLSSADYLAQNWTFSRPDGVGAGLIDNRGDITTQPGGFVVLAGGAIKNSGNIYAPEGRIALAAGDVVRMQVSPTQSVEVTIDESVKAQIDGLQSAIDNSGTLSAQEIRLKAKLIEALYARTINHTGVMTASTAKIGETGTIQLRAEGADASIVVGESGELTANGVGSGNGGAITLLADAQTQFDGLAEAKGGEISGNGGFIETSGTQTLRIGQTARVNASATNGAAGEWLMDPTDMTIHAGAGADDASNVYANNIQATLNTGTSVTVQTAAAGGAAGNLTVMQDTSIAKTSGGDATLTLKAHNSILMTGTSGHGISVTSTSGKLNLVLNSDTDQGADAGAGGAVRLDYTNINTNGGNITIGGGADPTTQAARGTTAHNDGITLLNGSVLNAGAGNISLRGKGRDIAGTSDLYGVYLDTASQIRTTSGHIAITGTGGNGTTLNYGVALIGANTLVTSQSGSVTVSGTGGTGTAERNYGVYIYNGAQITSTGAATLAVTGTGGGGTFRNDGIRVFGANTGIAGQNGTVTVNGQAGNGSQNYNMGLIIHSGAFITASGSGSLTIAGTGGAGTTDNHGIYFDGTNSRITSNTGNINITAQGGNGSGNNNNGFYLQNAGTVSASGSGNITITATKGANTSSSFITAAVLNTIGSNTMTGSIALRADDFSLTNLAIRNNGGEINFSPKSSGLSIGVNGGAGILQLTNAMLNTINTSVVQPSLVTLGDAAAGSGTVTIADNWNVNAYAFNLKVAGGNVNASNINAGARNLTLQANTGNITDATGTITANQLTLTASNGSVGSSGQRINTNVTSLSVNAASDAYLQESNALTLNASTVGGSLDVLTGGDITTGGAINGNHITLRSTDPDGDITLGHAVTATGSLSLTASGTGDITQTAGTLSATDLTLATATGSVGSAGSRISTAASTLTLNAGGSAYVSEANNVTLNASTVGGALDLLAAGDITTGGAVGANQITLRSTDADGDILLGHNLTATNTLSLTANGTGDILRTAGTLSAANITLAAGTGAIGSAGSRVATSTSTLTLNSGGSAYLSETDDLTLNASTVSGSLDVLVGGDITTGGATNGGNITLRSTGADGDILLGHNLTASNSLSLTASGTGDITQTAGTLSATDLTLAAGTGSIGSAGSRLSTTASTIALNTAGSAYLNEVNDVTLNASTVGGALDVLAGGDIAIGGAVSANQITLRSTDADGDILLGHNLTATNNLSLTANGTGDILRTAGTLSAANITLLTGTGSIGSPGSRVATATSTLTLNAGGSAYLAEADDITLNASTVGGALNIDSGGTMTLSGLLTAATANLSASGNILDGNGAANNLTTTGHASLTANGIIGALLDPLDVQIGGVLTAHAHTSVDGFAIVLNGAVGGLDVVYPETVLPPSAYWDGLKALGQNRTAKAEAFNVLMNGSILLGQTQVVTSASDVSFLLWDKQTPGMTELAQQRVEAPPSSQDVSELHDGPLVDMDNVPMPSTGASALEIVSRDAYDANRLLEAHQSYLACRRAHGKLLNPLRRERPRTAMATVQ